jgi:capsular polysaccharide export protein
MSSMIGTCFGTILNVTYRDQFLGQPIVRFYFHLGKLNGICGWGQKLSGRCAKIIAMLLNLPCFLLEDGFLRSCGLGVEGSPLLSLVVDDLGIYYDASQPSRLEALITTINLDEMLQTQALQALSLIRQHRLSKYNHAPEWQLPPRAINFTARVLVIDQTKNDMSVRLGGANAQVFSQMLTAALTENPQAEIWVKTHPDVLSGEKQGYLSRIVAPPRLHLLTQDISPLCLLEQVDKVYVATSQMGFEALMLNKPIICFGLPWYAGWGLSDDRHPNIVALRSRRCVKRSLEELFVAAYFHYTRYIQPETGQAGTIFDVIDWLIQYKTNRKKHEE